MRQDSKSEHLLQEMCDVEPVYRFTVDVGGAAFRYPSTVCGRLREDFALRWLWNDATSTICPDWLRLYCDTFYTFVAVVREVREISLW
jgi:ribosomal protein S7